jgi:hypothetical protein
MYNSTLYKMEIVFRQYIIFDETELLRVNWRRNRENQLQQTQ